MPAPTILQPRPGGPASETLLATAPAGHEPFITSGELCAWLRISDETLRTWRKRGIAPPQEDLPSGAIRYLPSKVMAWATTRQDAA